MKKFICLTLVFFGMVAYAAAPESRPLSAPFSIQNTFDESTQRFLLERSRKIMARMIGFDPFKNKITQSNHFESKLHVEMKEMLQSIFHGILGTNLNDVTMKVDVVNARYSIDDPGFYIEMPDNMDPHTLYPVIHTRPQGVFIGADKITLSFGAPSNSPLSELVFVLHDVSFTSKEMKALSMAIPAKIEIGKTGAIFSYDAQVQDLFDRVKAEKLQEDIELNVGKAEIVGGFSLQAGVEMIATQENILKAIQVRKRYISLLILRPVAELLGSLPQMLSTKYLKGTNSFRLPVGTQFNFQGHVLDLFVMGAHSFSKQLRFDFGLSIDGNPMLAPAPSSDSLSDVIDKKDAHVAFSFHESTLGQVASVIADTYLSQADLKRIKLGPEKIKFSFNDYKHPKIIADLDVLAGNASAVILGKKRIRLPVVLEPMLKIDYVDGVPVFSASIVSVQTDDKTLLEGAYGIKSDLGKIRFKKRIAKTVRKEIAKRLPTFRKEIPIKSLTGHQLDYIHLVNDGTGRLNIYFELDPAKNDSAATFWAGISDFITGLKSDTPN